MHLFDTVIWVTLS